MDDQIQVGRSELIARIMKGASEWPESGDSRFDSGFSQAISWVKDMLEEGDFGQRG